jgi:aflatoxin B1 aldehyde reductase
MYHKLYNKPRMVETLARLEDTTREEGTSKVNLVYRWVMYNSALEQGKGDGLVIGASSFPQLEQTLDRVQEGPLSEEALKKIDEIWELVKNEAPFDNYHGKMNPPIIT